MKFEKPAAAMILVVVVVLPVAVLASLLTPSWLGTLLACAVGLILGSFLRRKGVIK